MQTIILGMQAETFIHPGCGRDAGVVDLPVAREAATDLPFIAGSSLKGAMKDWARRQKPDDINELFGKADNAGQLLFGDARLLALPVRSLQGAYRWVTSPLLIERLLRDLRRSGRPINMDIPAVASGEALCPGEGELYLEELAFQITGRPEPRLIELLGRFQAHPESRQRLTGQLAVLCDDDLTWFARYGLAVQARNVLEEETKKSVNLWYEETLPPDSLFYSLVACHREPAAQTFAGMVEQKPFLQVGGNETVGHGWMALTLIGEGGDNG